FQAPSTLEVDAVSTPQTISPFATSISAGPADEVGQALTFEVTANSAPELFAQLPAVSSTGALTFAWVPGLSGVSAEITLTLRDDGGTALGGVDTSVPRVTELVIPDVVAPEVVAVQAQPGGEIMACTELRRRIGGLSVTFSEVMSTAVGEAGSVLDPANYEVIGAGPDRDITTFGCGGAVDDDVRIVAASVTAGELRGGVTDGGSVEAVLVDLPGLLDDGLYKLLVCDTVEDEAGNGLASTFEVPFRVSSENLFANGQFDCALEPWATVSDVVGGVGEGGELEFAFSSEDADDSSLSGSMAVTTLGSSVFAIGQCVDAPGSSYDLAARVRIEGLAGVEVTADLSCLRFSEPGCAGAGLGDDGGQFVLTPTGGAWQLLQFKAAGAESALCGLDLELTAGAGFEAFVDQLEATSRLFLDGFESGGTTAWSNTVP
ncbi:MAG: hypothetical protein AAFY88_11570, partial [Acidobacteriota bacterium]